MSNILLVPIQVRALLVKDKLKVSPPFLDMRRANSLDARLAVREMEETPNVGADFITSSLELDTDEKADIDAANLCELDAGIHLHWGVPDALSIMRPYPDEPDKRTFPAVPNRWLIICRANNAVVKKILVESDFTYTEDSPWYQRVNPRNPLCQFPHSLERFAALSGEQLRPGAAEPGAARGFQGLRAYHYVGRQIDLDALQSGTPPPPAGDEGYLPTPLTVAGYGHPTFAAVMTNCFNVFSAHHALDRARFQHGQEYVYDVIGFYDDTGRDCLRHFHGDGIADPIAALRAVYHWEVSPAGDAGALPTRSIYAGRVRVDISEGLARGDESQGAATIRCELAVGNTGVEALAALTARKLAPDETAARKIEEQLEAFSLDILLQDKKQDVPAQFDVLRHESSFRPLSGGVLWQVRPADETTPIQAVGLPAAIAGQLDTLNELMRLYARATGYIEALRRQLYSAYVHYQYAAHASSPLQRWGQGLGLGAATRQYQRAMIANLKYQDNDLNALYPEASHIWTYLQTQKVLVQELDYRLNGRRLPPEGDLRAVLDRYLGLVDEDILKLLHIEDATLTDIIQGVGSQLQQACEAQGMRLVPQEAPRYYKPNDPVLLLHGPDVPAITRLYGDDPDPLPCALVDEMDVDDNGDFANRYLAGANTLYPFDERETHVEEAVELEWQADIYPVLATERNPYGLGFDYPRNYIHTNFSLRENASDLVTHLPDDDLLAESVRTFAGRVILVPTANRQLQTNIINYLKRQTLFDFVYMYRAQLLAAGQDYNRAAVDTWWRRRPSPGVSGAAGPPADAPPTAELEWAAWAQRQPLFDAATFQTGDDDKLSGDALSSVTAWHGQLSRGFQDPIYTALAALGKLQDLSVLTQALGGLDEAMLMQNQTLQLPFVDLVDFAPTLRGRRDGRAYTDKIQEYMELRDTIDMGGLTNPEPRAFFAPIRTGILRLTRLHLLDSFGRVLDVQIDPPRQAHSLLYSHNSRSAPPPEQAPSDLDHYIYLPPRLNQPAQLNFRWQSAGAGATEADDLAEHGPICGWLLPNMLERSLMVYAGDGRALGTINARAEWLPAPGVYPAVGVGQIANTHLRRMVHFLTTDNVPRSDAARVDRQRQFFTWFVDALEDSLENIDPEDFAQHEAVTLLMGRPIALVRAAVELRVQGLPAEHQSFAALAARFYASPPPDDYANAFQSVEFPVRLGDHLQLNDGLVGYWIESAAGGEYEEGAFYAPNLSPDMTRDDEGDARTDPTIPSLRARPRNDEPAHTLSLCLSDRPRYLTMLVDPRGVVHATTGILPKKAIGLPLDLYVNALKKIAVTFLTAPILTDKEHVRVPMPEEPGYRWSWVQQESLSVWLAYQPDASEQDPLLTQQSTEVNFAAQRIVEGWLRLVPGE